MSMKINWKDKLSSRKFWAALAALITAILTAFNVSDLTVEQVTIIIGGIGALVAYIFAEAHIDANAVKSAVLMEAEYEDEQNA
jgi:pimeloyl-ACP methyl ester carboxylesterase